MRIEELIWQFGTELLKEVCGTPLYVHPRRKVDRVLHRLVHDATDEEARVYVGLAYMAQAILAMLIIDYEDGHKKEHEDEEDEHEEAS